MRFLRLFATALFALCSVCVRIISLLLRLQARPCMHALIRVLLHMSHFETAARLCRAARAHPIAMFQRELQHLLHGALEEAAAAKGESLSPARAHLTAVLQLINGFPERLQVIANVSMIVTLAYLLSQHDCNACLLAFTACLMLSVYTLTLSSTFVSTATSSVFTPVLM